MRGDGAEGGRGLGGEREREGGGAMGMDEGEDIAPIPIGN